MPFLKRLGYFLLGLSVGLIFLTIFLKKKTEETGTSFCYLPNCRVLKELRSKPLAYSEAVADLFESHQLDSVTVAWFLHEGDIDFSRSDTKSTPCRQYLIEGDVKGKKAELKLLNCSDSVRLQSYSIQ